MKCLYCDTDAIIDITTKQGRLTQKFSLCSRHFRIAEDHGLNKLKEIAKEESKNGI